MTNYDWQRMAHDLAIEVLEWEKSYYDCGCWCLEHSPGFAIRGLSGCDDGDCLNLSQCYLWKPWEDLNQAWMLFKKAIYEKTEIKVDPSEDISAEMFCKHLMFLSVYCSDLNLSDYEVEDE